MSVYVHDDGPARPAGSTAAPTGTSNGIERRDVVLLGSTGSIGTQAIDVIARNPARFRVRALAAGGADVSALAAQAASCGAEFVGVARADQAADLRAALAAAGSTAQVLAGPTAAETLAGMSFHDHEHDQVQGPAGPAPVVVLNGITGSIGLRPTLAALAAGHTLALANKESLIIGGPLVLAAAAPGQLVPVDSEHSALAQALRGGSASEVRRLVVTASGGPFRGRRRAELADVTVEQALRHPTWQMGPVITINSATLVNKGLEVIEAHLLFGVPMDRVDVVVHPQSMVHSMVEFTDGSTLAQASPPDMRLPIALGLGWPHRVPEAAPGCDWTQASGWTFEPLDDEAFPAVQLARAAGTAGGTAPGVYNAANEQAVAAFRHGRLGFLGIVDTVERVLGEHLAGARVDDVDLTVDDVLAADAWARMRADELIG